jgi:hypothetical protein
MSTWPASLDTSPAARARARVIVNRALIFDQALGPGATERREWRVVGRFGIGRTRSNPSHPVADTESCCGIAHVVCE